PYTTPPQAFPDDGAVYSVDVNNAFSSASCGAAVHVLHNPIAISASTRNDPNHIYVVYNKPVALNLDATAEYDLPGSGIFINGSAYGSSMSEVVISTDDIPSDTTLT